jgi:hypothetical protein
VLAFATCVVVMLLLLIILKEQELRRHQRRAELFREQYIALLDRVVREREEASAAASGQEVS